MSEDETIIPEPTLDVEVLEAPLDNLSVEVDKQNNNHTHTQKDTRKPRKKKKRRRKEAKRNQPQPHPEDEAFKQTEARFAACGRCCFFLAGYYTIHGKEDLKKAIHNSEAGWLTLNWNTQTQQLLHKSFGVRVDIDFYHYAGCCQNCQRQFVYHATNKGKTAVLRVQL